MTAADLDTALAQMTWHIDPQRFAFVGFDEPVQPALLAQLAAGPAQWTYEAGETTLVAPASALAAIRQAHPEARVAHPLFWVRFELAMDLGVIGFLARVATALAAADVPILALCGWSRDHLLIDSRYEGETRRVLTALFGPEAAPSPSS